VALNDPISPEQKKYIRDLVGKRDISSLSQAQQEFLADLSDENLNRMVNYQASAAIQALLACPYKKPVAPAAMPSDATDVEDGPAPEMPKTPEPVGEGYYFIVDPTNQQERFFRVRHGKAGGRWEGYVFLDVQASDYFYSVTNKQHRDAVLAEIAKDPVKSMNEYGLRLGRCGVCNRTLTDRDSILRGIGPICAAKLGPTPEQEDTLRRLGLLKNGTDNA